ncbi:acyl carrier protein [Sphingomonas sp.]|uniref:acyl carrier protein n=1 Tax=Sphingomonas sp. TaxID=28214 RepID=UPI0028AEBBB9|nr:phosphopantetheine-binding protein [Sphingomonas sp.]
MPNDAIVADIAAMLRHIKRDDNLDIGRETQISPLGIDSLDFVDLMFMIEEKYDISIEFNANTDGTFPFETVGCAAEAVGSLIEQKHQAA